MAMDTSDEAERSMNRMTASSELETEYCRDKEKDKNCHLLPYMDCVSTVGECITAPPISRCDDLRDGTQRNGRLAESGRVISISDLVWCKIRGPYWWPGKLIGRSAGVTKDYFLVVCFGDQERGPDRVSLVKPLWEQFPLMETQSGSDKLRHAVDCALEELSRRVEYVLTCRCVPREVHTRFESQAEVNAALVKNSSQQGAEDSVMSTASFTPQELVEYIKKWGVSPHGGHSRLLLSVAKSQLLAFSQWKGFSQLPEFISFGGKLENEADMTPLGDCCQNPIEIDGANPEFRGCHGMLAVKTGCCISDSSECKNSFQDGVHPGNKRKTFLALCAENCPCTSTDEVESSKRSRGNSFLFGEAAGPNESVLPCTGTPTKISTDQSVHMFEQNHMAMLEVQKKTKCRKSNYIPLNVVHPGRKRKSFPASSAKNCQRMSTDEVWSDKGAHGNSFGKAAGPNESILACTGALTSISVDQSMQFKQNHRAMHRIHNAASESNESLPLEEYLKESPSGRSNQNAHSAHHSCNRKSLLGYVSPKQMMLQLCLLAVNPMKQSRFPTCTVRYFSEVRNLVVPDYLPLKMCGESAQEASVVETQSRKSLLGYVSPKQMMLQLCLLAVNPIRQNRFLTCTVRYFSEFRNLVVPDHLPLKTCGESAQEASVVETQSTSTNFGVAEPMDLECYKDSVRTSTIISSIQEPQLLLENRNAGNSQLANPCERPVPSVVPKMDCQFCPAFTQDPRLSHENPLMEVKKPIDDASGTRIKCPKDPFSTACTIQSIPLQQPLLGSQNSGNCLIESERPIPSSKPQIGQSRRTLIQKLQIRRPNPYMKVKRPNNDILATMPERSKDSFMSSRIIQNIPKPQLSLGNQNAGDSLLKAPCKKPVPSMELQTDRQFCPLLIWKSQAPFQDPYVEAKRPSDDVSGTALEFSKDKFTTDRITQSSPEQKELLKEEDTGNSVHETPSKKPAHLMEPQINHHFGPASIREAQFPCQNPYVEVKKPDGDAPGSSKEDHFSTALVLTFTNLNLAPSVTKLNEMFSCFGPLKESESKVLNKSKQVKIVFKNRSDAETAFIELGEHRIFGPLLRSYRLKYVRSCSLEASPSHLRRRNKKFQHDNL
ncbi:hypothetical protein BT93_K0479 [Corymbia citriodora subsp. variegata]|nr:hypothetical protein BT93_K0479 [Corymbia citriodora subsp. variegata]KAF8006185.1 hypothetical protein BT93_K0479 [Corymbia citriodora subsp. variegata]